MTARDPVRLVLGPQRPVANVADAEAAAGLPEGTVSVISAGWQEDEGDNDELQEIIGRPFTDLRLYARAEDVFAVDENLANAYRERQNRLKEQQRLYRLRLRQLSTAARHVIRADGEPELLAAEQRHAISQLRALDRHHLHRTEHIHQQFSGAFRHDTHPLLAQHNKEISDIINSCAAVVLTGGNIAVLLNRIRLFAVDRLFAGRPLVAWSAGAMVLTGRIVLYHDRAPQGRREPEVFGAGFGLIPGCIFLPDPAQRLRENERSRVELMSRRFSPDTCVTLDNGTALQFNGARIADSHGARRLNRQGRVVKLRAA